MKKITKTLTASVLALAASSSLLSVPASHIAYAEETPASTVKAGDILTAKSLTSTGTVGRAVEVPKAVDTVLGGGDGSVAKVEAVVTRPDGRTQNLVDGTDSWSFTPRIAGTYKLQYKGTNTAGVTTLSEVFYIKVTADTYEMKMALNGDIILPATVDTNTTRFDGGVVKSVTLPNPTVYDENGFAIFENGAVNAKFARFEKLPDLIAEVTGDAKTELEEELKSLEKLFQDYNISTTAEEGSTSDLDFYKGCTLEIEVTTESKTYTIGGTDALTQDPTTKLYSFVPEQGTNVIRYVFKAADGTNLQSITKTVIGSNTYDHTKIKLGWKAPNRPTTASLNDRVSLPLAEAYDKSDANSAVNSKTLVKVYLRDNGSLVEQTVGEDEDGLYFIPTVKDGTYVIEYNVQDYYGNVGVAESYSLEKIVDGKAPTMYIVEAFDYTKTADAIIAMHNAEWMIPTKVGRDYESQSGKKGEIVFPAMFGTDSVVDYENLTFYRSITSSELDGSINLLDTKYLKAIGDEDVTTLTKQNQKAAHEAVIDLTALKDGGGYVYPAGDYTVTYTIRDGNGYSATKSYTFTIVDEYTDTEAPTITYADNFPTLVQDGQDVKFSKPTIVDAQDSYIKIRYYVVIGSGDSAKEVEIFEKDDIISFNMSDTVAVMNDTIYNLALANNNEITIKTVATDYHGNKTEETVKITVRNAKDTTAATFATSVAADFASNKLPTIENEYKQGGTVTVAGITITDNDPNLSIIVTVRDAAGNKVYGVKSIGTIERKTTDGTNGTTKYTHPGVSFVATKAESYTVTYTAVDAGNNIVAYTVLLPTLSDSEKPVIVGATTGKLYTIELGQKLDLGRVTVKDNVDTDLVVSLECTEHPDFVNGTIFAPTETGSFEVKYTAKDSANNDAEPVIITVKVEDTTAPILNIINKDQYGTTIKSQTTVTDKKDFVAIELPSFSAEDNTYDFGLDAGALNMFATGKIEISAPDGKTYTVDNKDSKYKISYNGTKEVYTFVPTTKGTYTVTYTAKDASNNEAEKYVITVMVGDTVLPTVNYTGTLSANLKVGDVLRVDKDKITITDNIPETDDFKFTPSSITLEDESGNVIEAVKEGDEEQILAYTFKNAGTYTLTITARDEAGNSNYYSYQINVTTTGSNSVFNSNNVTGVVLIVVSLLILGGVIIYFARGKKKVSPKKTIKKVAKKEETPVEPENKD